MGLRKVFTPYKTAALVCTISFVLLMLAKANPLVELTTDPLRFFAQVSSILGMTLFAFTSVLMLRNKFVEDWCDGLDNAYSIHHTIGILGFILLINHPTLLILRALSEGIKPLFYVIPGIIFSYSLGIISLYLLTLFIFLTIFIKLPYNIWKFTHQFMGVALLFGFFHLINIVSDVSQSWILFYWMVLVSLVGLLCYFYHEFVYDFVVPKYKYYVGEVNDLGDAVEICLAPVDIPIRIFPGQFIYVSFEKGSGVSSETHPFSVSSAAGDTILRLSVNKSGDYTKRLTSLKKESVASVTGPFGKFYEHSKNFKEIVLVAGGIGVTPFLGLIKSDLSSKYYLFHSVKDLKHAYYNDELVSWESSHTNLVYRLYNSNAGQTLTASEIHKEIPVLNNKAFFLCGPKQMMSDLSKQLVTLGLSKAAIFKEDFNIK